jgi:ABC-type Fe3+-siderophore transport system permease subunit
LAFSYWFDKPWFLTEGKLAAVLIIPSSWGCQLGGHLHQHRTAIKLFLAPLPGKKKTSARGVSHAHPLLCFCFALLYFFACIFLSKRHKKLVPFIVVIFVGQLLSCFIMLSINGWFL